MNEKPSEWDKLKGRIDRMLIRYHPYSPDPVKKLYEDIKSVGDKNSEKAKVLDKFHSFVFELPTKKIYQEILDDLKRIYGGSG